jgi:enoyl-CoA hydratase/carnithine racemase
LTDASNTVRFEKRDRKCYITLNRPDVLNALNSQLIRDLIDAITRFEEDDDVAVGILTGAGGKAFSTGADLKEAADRSIERRAAGVSHFQKLARCPKPLIAAIDGYAVAAGLEIALYCDIRVATEQSQLGLPEPRRSLLAGPGLHHLSRMIPLGEALLMQLTGSPMSARRCYEIGLIQRIVSDRQRLFTEVDAIADEILLCAPAAVRSIKHIVKVGRNLPVEYSEALAKPIEESLYSTGDSLEGARAFTEKRAPKYKTP